jgi:hypothetical protein
MTNAEARQSINDLAAMMCEADAALQLASAPKPATWLMCEPEAAIAASRLLAQKYGTEQLDRMKNATTNAVARLLADRGQPGSEIITELLRDTFDMIEDMSVRTAYMIGLSRAFDFCTEAAPKVPARKRGGKR